MKFLVTIIISSVFLTTVIIAQVEGFLEVYPNGATFDIEFGGTLECLKGQ